MTSLLYLNIIKNNRLSNQFLVSNKSDPKLIYNFLISQLEIIKNDYGLEIEDNYYFLLFTCKQVYFDIK